MLGLSLAACGKQDTDDGVKKFYNSMNDTTEAVGESTQSGLKAAAEENGKSVKKSDMNNGFGWNRLPKSFMAQIWQSHVSFRHTSG